MRQVLVHDVRGVKQKGATMIKLIRRGSRLSYVSYIPEGDKLHCILWKIFRCCDQGECSGATKGKYIKAAWMPVGMQYPVPAFNPEFG